MTWHAFDMRIAPDELYLRQHEPHEKDLFKDIEDKQELTPYFPPVSHQLTLARARFTNAVWPMAFQHGASQWMAQRKAAKGWNLLSR